MYKCIELNKEFATKEELFKALKSNAKDIIGVKKAQILKSYEKGASVKTKCLDITKANDTNKELFKDDSFYYIAVNTIGILDSHTDLHVKGIWNKSAKERTRKNYLVDTHIMSMGTTLAKKEDVEIFVAELPFSSLGKTYKGSAEVLVYKIPKDKMKQEAREWLDEGYDIEASVKMQYVNIDLAMNSEDEEDVEFKTNYDSYLNQIANKEDYEKEYGEITHYWIVKEAKNIGESSLVLQGSNPVTGQIKVEPSNDTQPQKEAVKVDTSHIYLLM